MKMHPFSELAPQYHSERSIDFYGAIAREVAREVVGPVEAPALGLDVGCGTGISTSVFSRHFTSMRWLGVDVSEPMLRLARSRDGDGSVSYSLCESTRLPLVDQSASCLFSSMAYHWMSGDMLAEWMRVLCRGGQLCVAAPLAHPAGQASGNLWLRDLVRKNFRLVKFGKQLGVSLEKMADDFSAYGSRRQRSFTITEEYSSYSELVEVLRIRGSFYAIFGDDAARAIADCLEAAKENDGAVKYDWAIGLFAGVKMRA